MKKVLSIVLALVLVLGVAACGTTPTEPEDTKTSEEQQSGETEGTASYKVGICQLVQHVALDAATQGFIDALNALLPGQVEIDNQNASGEPTNCTTIVGKFVGDKVDLIMANATPALQAAKEATDTIPVLGTSITAYNVALDDESITTCVGTNVSGTSDLASFEDTVAVCKEWFPEAKKVGILYCSAEANSQYQVDMMSEGLKKEGYEVTPYAFSDTNDLATICQKACDESDFLYIPTDNTAAANTEAIANIAVPAKTPIIAGEEGITSGCGVATLSISYYDLGYKTGEMAAAILKGEADVKTMEIGYAPTTKKYNKDMCEKYGLTAPEGYEAIKVAD